MEHLNFKLSTLGAQSDVFGVQNTDFSKIRQIKLFRQGISVNLKSLSLKLKQNIKIPT